MGELVYHKASEWKLTEESIKIFDTVAAEYLLLGDILIIREDASDIVYRKKLSNAYVQNHAMEGDDMLVFVLCKTTDTIISIYGCTRDNVIPTEQNELYNVKKDLAECQKLLADVAGKLEHMISFFELKNESLC